MKSEKARELIEWLRKDVGLRNYRPIYIEKLIEISEIELSGNTELLEKKVNEFKSGFSTDHNAYYDIH